MTVREFVSARLAARRARKAHKAMFRVYGESWARNAAGVVDLLSAPSPVYVVDAAMLNQAVRGAVAEALAGAEEQTLTPFSAEPVYGGEPEESFDVEPTAEADEPSLLKDAVFEDPDGVAAVPMMFDDARRQQFLRTFFQEQRPVRGPVIPTR